MNKRVLIIISMIVILMVIFLDTRKVFIITGNSMEPTIHSNSIAFIKITPIENIEKGDIICFINRDKTIVHRVTSLYTNTNNNIEIRTKGDNNRKEDEAIVNKDNYIGELSISIWIDDIVMDILPKLISLAFIIISALLLKMRRYSNE